MLTDYGFDISSMILLCDNMSAINIFKNLVQHSRTKHIDIRYHFIHELVEKGTILIDYVQSEQQKADLFTKPLDALRFDYLRKALGVCLVQ